MAFNTQERCDIFPPRLLLLVSAVCHVLFFLSFDVKHLPVAAKGYVNKCGQTDLLIQFIRFVPIF